MQWRQQRQQQQQWELYWMPRLERPQQQQSPRGWCLHRPPGQRGQQAPNRDPPASLPSFLLPDYPFLRLPPSLLPSPPHCRLHCCLACDCPPAAPLVPSRQVCWRQRTRWWTRHQTQSHRGTRGRTRPLHVKGVQGEKQEEDE